MHTITIDADRCRHDAICVAECPFLLFSGQVGDVPTLRQGAQDACIGCGHCVAVCPGAAITLDGQSPDACDTPGAPLPTPDQLETLVRTRRSIRAYTAKPVERAHIEHLLQLADWAPTAKNLRPVHWQVYTDRSQVAAIASLVVDWLREAAIMPEVVAACDAGHDLINRNAPCLLVAHTPHGAIKPVEDAAIALTTVELAAPVLGLGACWAGFFMTAAAHHPPLRAHLALPEGHSVRGGLMLGYPRFGYPRIPHRTPAPVEWK